MLNVARGLPRPGQVPVRIRENLRVLLLSDAINSLTRRVENELTKHQVSVVSRVAKSSDDITQACKEQKADVVIGPFLKAVIPEHIYTASTTPFLIVHPGIAGDRGASSIDWAILERQKEWGVTVLEASEEMDAGAIWSTENFAVPRNATKTGLYNGSVSDTAVRCVVDAISRYSQNIGPVGQDNNPELQGQLKRNMKHSDRKVSWEQPADDICAQVRMSDTVPGAIGKFDFDGNTSEFRIFDAFVERAEKQRLIKHLLDTGKPGEIVAKKNKSVLVKAGDDHGVWIGQMKKNGKSKALKLPFTDGVPEAYNVPLVTEPAACDDVTVLKSGPTCYVNFDFYNGAMDKEQAGRLQDALRRVSLDKDIKVVVLTGGERFFSTGIHLCAIENSNVKQLEAWANINAIDDVIKTIVTMPDKATVAMLRGNAGAGGAMLAAACDVTMAHSGVLLTPSYKTMHLFGSEYWTYFLPQRVGHQTAKELVQDTTPISARKAHDLGILDYVINADKSIFEQQIPDLVLKLLKDGEVDKIIREKRVKRDSDWRHLLEEHRKYELDQMRTCFRSEDFQNAMHKFVYKL